MNIEVLTAIIGITGVLVGAVTQYIFTRATESMKHYQELKSHAYTDFIKAFSGLAISQKNHSDDEKYKIQLTDAKVRISVYGSKQVIQSMADFLRDYSALNSQEAMDAFTNLIQKIRGDTKKEKVPDDQIHLLLFGREQST